ncbi:MAG: SDR family NAD(P)-dependent oxidoreductase [Bacteroidales bacterium]|nr:SDR family NAD(P)-dependent oxidoreductase [Bacteroidales bacterium]MCF8388758.1 SDR family NAD(P)-dependent oxidoreductase [Bacteroidales bacterium]
MENKIAMITGATSGIGKACAVKFAQNGYNVIITGRRRKRLENLAMELSSEYGALALILTFDIRIHEEVKEAIDKIPESWQRINVLINNAGLASGLAPIYEGEIENWEEMIDTNIKGLLYITRYISPMMLENGEGHIINIGSIAGREAYPNGNVYNATKFAVDGLTKAMRIDLYEKNIRVTQVAPGAVETEFSMVRFKGDTKKAEKVYQGYQPLMADDVGEVAYYVTTLPPHVNISDLLIMPTAQASATRVNKSS